MVNENQFLYSGDDSVTLTDAVEDMPWAPAVLSDKGLFLLLLYDKAISCMDEALTLIEQGDMVGKGDRLIHAQEIVLQLSDALDKSTGDIADNLVSSAILSHELGAPRSSVNHLSKTISRSTPRFRTRRSAHLMSVALRPLRRASSELRPQRSKT